MRGTAVRSRAAGSSSGRAAAGQCVHERSRGVRPGRGVVTRRPASRWVGRRLAHRGLRGAPVPHQGAERSARDRPGRQENGDLGPRAKPREVQPRGRELNRPRDQARSLRSARTPASTSRRWRTRPSWPLGSPPPGSVPHLGCDEETQSPLSTYSTLCKTWGPM